jgi:hypothetical protein
MGWCKRCLSEHDGDCLDSRRSAEFHEALRLWLSAQPPARVDGWSPVTRPRDRAVEASKPPHRRGG